ncbi:MAG: hypothetical protein PHF86_07965 [Candidatus Nanoarchaeia archaeon]|nr:hypothetical protein [Candidatus Nanoarchaeia archaeon]
MAKSESQLEIFVQLMNVEERTGVQSSYYLHFMAKMIDYNHEIDVANFSKEHNFKLEVSKEKYDSYKKLLKQGKAVQYTLPIK